MWSTSGFDARVASRATVSADNMTSPRSRGDSSAAADFRGFGAGDEGREAGRGTGAICGKERTLVGESLPRHSLLSFRICASSVKTRESSLGEASEAVGRLFCAAEIARFASARSFAAEGQLPASTVIDMRGGLTD